MLDSEAILYYADHPVEFVEDVIQVTPDPQQAAILRSVAGSKMTSVRSGHGVGKSAVEAWSVIWFMTTRPFPKIPCTAPTQHQLFDILWAEVSKWLRNNPALSRELMWTKEKVYMKGYPEEWFAVARTASKPDALQGFHAEDLLFIIDEASGVDDVIFEPVLGALSTPGARLLMCGNPTQLSGFFYDSHNKNRASYSTFHIDGRKSGRVPQDFVQTIINMYGEDSDVFRVRVAGEFPLQEDDIFIPLSLVEASIMTEYTPRARPTLVHIGCDVARFGDDKTVIGYKVDEQVTLHKKRQGQDTMKTADDIILLGEELVARYKLTDPIPVKIDDGGVGGGVVDPLPEDAPFFVKDYYDYYKTPRGYHPRSLNSNGGWNVTGCMSFLNQPILAYAEEIRSAVLVMHGDKAHSCYFSKDAFARLKGDNKELLLIPDAVHTDLYDRMDIIPFDKLVDFFQKNLK